MHVYFQFERVIEKEFYLNSCKKGHKLVFKYKKPFCTDFSTELHSLTYFQVWLDNVSWDGMMPIFYTK